MRNLSRLLLLTLAATLSYAQLTVDQKVSDFQSLAALYAKRYLALSMELVEFSESGTYKHNNVHAKFKKPTG